MSGSAALHGNYCYEPCMVYMHLCALTKLVSSDHNKYVDYDLFDAPHSFATTFYYMHKMFSKPSETQ